MDKKEQHPLSAYAAWTQSMWMPSQNAGPTPQRVIDRAVMGMGFGGEASEVLEAARGRQALDRALLAKELGDALFYWCVCCAEAQLPVEKAWPAEHGFSDKPDAMGTRAHLEQAAIEFVISSGKCQEAIKKMIRDGAGVERLAGLLPKAAEDFALLCKAAGFSIEEVVVANQEKLRGRLERGTLRGDGNDR